MGRPRDIDLVVEDTSIDALADHFGNRVERQTRFGGLKLKHESWGFDVWPLAQTYALRNVTNVSLADLPATTFLNLEAIAVEVWPTNERRAIYSDNDQFFDGILNRVVELNNDETEYPVLNAIRSLRLAFGLNFDVGPRLADFLVAIRPLCTESEVIRVQESHYGSQLVSTRRLGHWMNYVATKRAEFDGQIPLPIVDRHRAKATSQQLLFWDQGLPRIRMLVGE